jgi:hypothetical protein
MARTDHLQFDSRVARRRLSNVLKCVEHSFAAGAEDHARRAVQ